MKAIIYFLFFQYFIVSIDSDLYETQSQDHKSLIVINTVKETYKIDEEIVVKIKIKNIFKNDLKIPEDVLYVGYGGDPHSDAEFELQKIETHTKKLQLPTGDYSYPEFYQNGKIYMELKKDCSKEYTFWLNNFYHLLKGTYRIKAKFLIPSVNNLNVKYSYSNWSYFKIE